MGKRIDPILTLVTLGVLITISVCRPSVLSDQSVFLKEFIGINLLSLLGVIVSITLASAANIYLELNRLEARFKKMNLSGTKNALKNSAIALVTLLALAIILIAVKKTFSPNIFVESITNSLSIVVLLCNILILSDVTRLVFRIPSRPERDDE